MSKPVRITEEFVRTFRAVKSGLGGTYDADVFARKLEEDENFVAIVDHLDSLVRSVLEGLKKKKDKTVKQAHPEFAKELSEFKTRWEQLPVDYLMWRMGPLELDIEALIKEASSSQSGNVVEDRDDEFEFDDEKESGASLVSGMVKYVRDHAEFGGGQFNRMAEAFLWFEARGLDLDVFERRWKKIPIIFVPKHASDGYDIAPRSGSGKRDLKGHKGLYWLLDEALHAYYFGADAAAICVCRALTEELIEKFYLDQNEISEITARTKSPSPLKAFIKASEEKHPQVKKHNLVTKIEVANEVLHQAKLDISSMQKWSGSENLIRQWVLSLKTLIENAPKAR